MSQRSIAAAIASRPAVKFRLTGTLPANDAAMLASAPPTEAGSSRPTSRVGWRVPADGAREQQAADERAAEGQLAAGRIGHAERRPTAASRCGGSARQASGKP